MHSLVLNDDFCAMEGCEETEQRLGSVEEDCEESELMLGLEVALQEMMPRLGSVEDCEATETRLGDTEEGMEPRLGSVEVDCEANEARLGLQEAVDESELRLGLILVVAAEQSLEEVLYVRVDD